MIEIQKREVLSFTKSRSLLSDAIGRKAYKLYDYYWQTIENNII